MLQLHPTRRWRGPLARGAGAWASLSIALLAAGALDAATPDPCGCAPAPETVTAGPIDDTLDYLDCLIRRLLGLPCDNTPASEPPEAPPMPEEPVT